MGNSWFQNFKKNRIQGQIDGRETLRQSIYNMINTERYADIPHDWDYGSLVSQYVGKDFEYIAADIGREIKECLMIDDRINNVYDFAVTRVDINSLHVKFSVDSIYGKENLEVTI